MCGPFFVANFSPEGLRPLKIIMNTYNIHLSEYYTELGYRTMKRFKEFKDLEDFGVQIAFLSSEEEKTRNHQKVLAECRKVQKEYAWAVPFDFMIIVYEPNVIDLSEKQMGILMRHELKHIGIDLKGNEPRYYVVPHDVEDFKDILRTYGIDWARSEIDA